MTVHAVRGRRELAEFVNLPWRLYGGDPNWIAPLKASVRAMLDQRRHPFYAGGKDAEIELFLARDGREVVGRVAAIVYHRHNQFHHENVAFFGFFESVDSPAVAAELLGVVESWARERGATAVRGPANPSQNYECGLLIEGFDRPPVLMMTYNPPSYVGLVEGAGYAKAKDLYAYISQVHGASLERLERLADRTRRRNPALSTRGANLKDFAGEVRLAKEIYNAAWEDNWGFVPVTDAEFDWLAKELKPIVLPELVRFAFIDGEPVGLLLCLPDWNPVMGDLDGEARAEPLREADANVPREEDGRDDDQHRRERVVPLRRGHPVEELRLEDERVRMGEDLHGRSVPESGGGEGSGSGLARFPPRPDTNTTSSVFATVWVRSMPGWGFRTLPAQSRM